MPKEAKKKRTREPLISPEIEEAAKLAGYLAIVADKLENFGTDFACGVAGVNGMRRFIKRRSTYEHYFHDKGISPEELAEIKTAVLAVIKKHQGR